MESVEIIRLFLLFGGAGFMLIGGIPLIIGIVQMYKYSHMKKHCTQKIGGRIIRYKNLSEKSSKNTPTSNFAYKIKWWDELLVIFILNKGQNIDFWMKILYNLSIKS